MLTWKAKHCAGVLVPEYAQLVCDECDYTIRHEAKDADPKKRSSCGRAWHLLDANPGWRLVLNREGTVWMAYCYSCNKKTYGAGTYASEKD